MEQPLSETITQRYGVRSVWAHLAMCTATAVLLTLAFPLPGWSFMAYFALVPVGVLAMRTRRLWTLAWTSYVVFFVWWSLRVMWLKHVESAAPFAMAAVCAGYFTAALLALAVVQRRFRGAMTLTLPLFWCAQEIIRSVWPVGGFAWFTLASSQAAWLPGQRPGYLVQSADLFGWVTVSFLVAMTSGLLVDLIARPLTKRRSTGALRPRRTVMAALLVWLCCFGSAMVYGYFRVANTPTADTPGARTITLGIVQTNVPQSNKQQGTSEELYLRKQKDFERMLELSIASAGEDPHPDLIIWPETMITYPINDEAYQLALDGRYIESYANEIRYYRQTVQAHADEAGIMLIVGSQVSGMPTHERSMNSALLVTPGGHTLERYSKMHLVPMGEYIPGPGWLRDLFFKYLSPYDYDYTVEPGERVVIFTIPQPPRPEDVLVDTSVRFATPICYEDVVATQCRTMVYGNNGVKRADLLVNLTNDGWYPGSHQGYQHLQIAALRCIENRVPMARSVNTGVSGLIDSAGRVQALVTVDGRMQEVDGYMNVRAVLDPRSTLYGRVREGVWVGLCAFAGAMLLGVVVPSASRRRGSAK